MKYVVKGKNGFDGKTVLHDFYFIVEDGIISEVGDLKDYKGDLDVLDLSDKYVIPGLIDSHVHVCLDPYAGKMIPDSFELVLTVQKNLETILHNGVVCVRDLGAPAHFLQLAKKAQKNGKLKGADLFIAGEAICATGGHGWQFSAECNSETDVRKAVRENVKEGVDCIKLMVTGGINTPGDELAPLELTANEIRTGVEEAHRRGKKVAVHTHGRTGIKTALECGVDSIEHGLLMDAELSELAKNNGTYLVPTLSAPYFATVQGLKKDPNSKSFLKSKEVMEIHRKNVLHAYKTGVNMAMGTDSGTPFNGFDTVLTELELLSEIGVENADVLRMSTFNGAKLLGVENMYGSLEKGKKASFVVLEESPIDDIKNINKIVYVYKDGELVR